MINIIVNDPSAVDGGALLILKDLLNKVIERCNNGVMWYVFVSKKELVGEYEGYKCLKVIYVNAKPWRNRLIWDTFGIKSWLRKHSIKPDVGVSLMSVGIPFLDIPQVVYIHQSLPFGDFNNFKCFELKARLYKKLIYTYMKFSIRKNRSIVIVQTNWMKDAVSRKLKIARDRIIVIPPIISVKDYEPYEVTFNGSNILLFYPAIPRTSYKNHELLIKALKCVKVTDNSFYKKLKVVFTFNPKDNMLTKYYFKLAEKLEVNDIIDYVGYLSKKEMVTMYQRSSLILFPSLLETFGLPLLEAAHFGKPIFVMDKPYSHDVLEDYKDCVKFLPNNPEIWANEIINFDYGKKCCPIKYEREIHQDIIDIIYEAPKILSKS